MENSNRTFHVSIRTRVMGLLLFLFGGIIFLSSQQGYLDDIGLGFLNFLPTLTGILFALMGLGTVFMVAEFTVTPEGVSQKVWGRGGNLLPWSTINHSMSAGGSVWRMTRLYSKQDHTKIIMQVLSGMYAGDVDYLIYQGLKQSRS